MSVYILDAHIPQSNPRASRSGSQLAPETSGFANLHLESTATGRATLSALPANLVPELVRNRNTGGTSGAAAAGRLLAGTDPPAAGQGTRRRRQSRRR